MERKNVAFIVILFSIVIYLYSHYNPKDKLYDYLGTYDYTVGNVENFFRRGSGGHHCGRSSIYYSYEIDKKSFKKSYDILFYDLPDSPEVHEKYIVLYNVNNPENSIMLGDYKIESEEDLINFEKLFHSGSVKY